MVMQGPSYVIGELDKDISMPFNASLTIWKKAQMHTFFIIHWHVSLTLLFNNPNIIALPDNTTDLHQHIILR
ncbi:hypothetical protein PISMIDRAFT_15448 [Pisolithus microcarpus 441]|uniref:Unplaced genomic scaffold scaffold_157, whole genome shotgun sequence n=1 Tax=Pisolithus microcarpus 441 TaxID=765257 RepID=A0A0C9YK32_9AGAM|nr:hypothetical protein PISMIDRAFT_15448 [Pisolithus microcarpus 441]